MAQRFREGRIAFDFPNGWLIARPEASAYYSKHFQHFAPHNAGNKETDFLAWEPSEKQLWLMEVKDYRAHPRTKMQDLADEVVLKARDTLALLRAAQAQDPGQSDVIRDFAAKSAKAKSIRIVLHCALPKRPSKLFPGVKDAANLQAKLRERVRAVDPHAHVTGNGNSGSVPWSVA